MKYIFLLFVFVFTVQIRAVYGEKSPKTIKLWNGFEAKELKKAKSKLLVFTPDSAVRNGSAVIICPGGSYAYLGMRGEGYQIAKWLNKLGFTAFVLRYRVGWDGCYYPSEIQDLQRAIQIVRENSREWNINPASVGVMGFSAGGHLVGTSAVYYDENFMKPLGVDPKVSLRPDFVVMNYPVVSMRDSIAHEKSKKYLLGDNIHSVDLQSKLSLEENLHPGMPPVFIMHARGDKTVDYRNSLNFYRNALKIHLPVKYILYNCEGHGFGLNIKKNKIASSWIYECEKWFVSLGLKIKLDGVPSLYLTEYQNYEINTTIQ